MPPTTKSTTAQLLSFTETVGGGGGGGGLRARALQQEATSGVMLSPSSLLPQSNQKAQRILIQRWGKCSCSNMRRCYSAALRVLIIEEVTVFASSFASPSPSSLFYHQCFHLGCESASTWPSAGY